MPRPHDLRHTCATWLKNAGIPSRMIDGLMATAAAERPRPPMA
jgi:integrase